MSVSKFEDLKTKVVKVTLSADDALTPIPLYVAQDPRAARAAISRVLVSCTVGTEAYRTASELMMGGWPLVWAAQIYIDTANGALLASPDSRRIDPFDPILNIAVTAVAPPELLCTDQADLPILGWFLLSMAMAKQNSGSQSPNEANRSIRKRLEVMCAMLGTPVSSTWLNIVNSLPVGCLERAREMVWRVPDVAVSVVMSHLNDVFHDSPTFRAISEQARLIYSYAELSLVSVTEEFIVGCTSALKTHPRIIEEYTKLAKEVARLVSEYGEEGFKYSRVLRLGATDHLIARNYPTLHAAAVWWSNARGGKHGTPSELRSTAQNSVLTTSQMSELDKTKIDDAYKTGQQTLAWTEEFGRVTGLCKPVGKSGSDAVPVEKIAALLQALGLNR